MLSYHLSNIEMKTQKLQQVRRSPSNDFVKGPRFGEAFEPYRQAFILGDTHQQNFIINEFVSSLLAVESCKLAEEQALMNCCTEDKPLEEILTCALCKEVFHNPVTLICGHTFCLECLASTRQQQGSVCPDCGQESSGNYMSNIVVRELSQIWFPEKTSVRSSIAEATNLLNQRKTTEFMALVDKLLNKYPENVDLLYLRANGFMCVKRNNEALKDLEFACNVAPFNSMVLHARGELLASIDEPEEAMAMFLRAAALKPNDSRYRSSVTSYFEKLLENMLRLTCPSKPGNSTYNSSEHDSRVLKSLPMKSQAKVEEATTMTERSSELIEKRRNESACCTVKTNEAECSHANTTAAQPKVNIPLSELQCKLCFNLIYKPVTTPCGHSFCRSCLNRSLDHRLECPCCRTNLQSYLRHLLQGNIGSCEVLEKILFLKFKADYEVRRNSYETELMQFSRYESNTAEIPIFVCTLAVPDIACPLHIFEPSYKLMIRRCLESGSRQFGMCASDPEHGFATVGTTLYIKHANIMPDGRSVVHTVGSRRFQVLERGSRDGYNTAKVAWIEDECDEGDYAQLNYEVYNTMLHWYEKLPNEQQTCIERGVGAMPGAVEGTNKNGPKWLWWLLVAMPLNVEARRIILSMTSVIERLNSVKRFLAILISRQ